ncbi:hypothetical protein VWH97_06690 [Escherichia coli O157]|nr:hypothetical protein [Escherichia coli O157]
MNKALKELHNLMNAEIELTNTISEIVHDMITQYKKSLIGKKVECWDYNTKTWFETIISDVNVKFHVVTHHISDECYVEVTIGHNTRHERFSWYNLKNVKFIED